MLNNLSSEKSILFVLNNEIENNLLLKKILESDFKNIAVIYNKDCNQKILDNLFSIKEFKIIHRNVEIAYEKIA